ncbi:uncharacterized protein LOC128711656 [Anopheles marshallii]|uniref:uncharacterized protein LOC128711656 n=1 Tax=Anopheles marshallii TaxID=1521116 RepID=UPI00237B7D31|nr:uncharacterized protein LOC128711656 [Anopheles marshallii]
MFITTIIMLNVLTLNAIVPVIAETVKYFKIDRVNNCDPADRFAVTMLPEYSVNNKPNENLFNCTLRTKEEIEGPLKYEANIKRCEMDLSKCEFFNTIETDELCVYFEDAGFRDRFLNSMSQPMTCPIKPGDYQFINTKWDMSAIVNLPGSAYRWKIVTSVTQIATGRTVYCSEMMARIVVIRKKSNRIHH